jgi:hypothetical protein
MEIKVKETTIFNCSLERAFKTPMLCDVSKVHTGYGLMPAVTHCEYTYTLHYNNFFLFPLNWLFANAFWKTYMRKVIENIRALIISKEPYKYE